MKIGTIQTPQSGKMRTVAIYSTQNTGHQTCTSCGQVKPRVEFSKAKGQRTGRAKRCKVCDAERTRLYRQRKAAEACPEKYSMCDDCDGFFHTYGKGGNRKHPLFVCPHCQSSNILRCV